VEAQENAALGRWGEAWVLEYERRRWADHPEVLKRIIHVAATIGDGLGYDIMSVSHDGSVRYIEVKTTRGGPATPWFVTPAELTFSAEHADAYALYRVYSADPSRGTAEFFILEGDLRDHVDLEPIAFQARLKSSSGRGRP
jgi:hypothetical protein